MANREKLIDAAQDVLIEGQGHLEMQVVAKRAGVSVGLAYHHFGSKAGLISAVVEAFYSQLDEAVFGDPKWPFKSWAEKEKGRIGAYVAFHYAHSLSRLVIGPLSRAPEVLDVEAAFANRHLSAGAKMLISAQDDGVVPMDIDPYLTIALMIGGIRQALIHAMLQTPQTDPGKLTDDIWAFMAAALRLTTTPAT